MDQHPYDNIEEIDKNDMHICKTISAKETQTYHPYTECMGVQWRRCRVSAVQLEDREFKSDNNDLKQVVHS